MRACLVRCAFTAIIATAPTFSGAAAPQPSPSAEREVLAIVQRFFDAMASCDGTAARSLSLPEGRLYRREPAANAAVRSSTFEEFNSSLDKCARKMLERMWTPQVRVHEGIASVWTPYDFWLNGSFSHCGIDSFELVKTPEGWKLIGGVYTIERSGCAPSPLGPPPGSGAAR